MKEKLESELKSTIDQTKNLWYRLYNEVEKKDIYSCVTTTKSIQFLNMKENFIKKLLSDL